ncbi:MAG: hypothetical protein HY537_03145 [Deltaproteobacteria bacterium]|nr:hypothetical protein [Deltaproteobacteria bacterium]
MRVVISLVGAFLSVILISCGKSDTATVNTPFGTTGYVLTDFNSGNESRVKSIAVAADGKILAVGWTSGSNNTTDIALARYNTDGSLDSTFGTGGKVTTDFLNKNDFGLTVAAHPDGSIFVGGQQNDVDAILVKHKSDGTLDTSFGTAGRITVTSGYPGRGAIQANGKILFGGGGSSSFYLRRYSSDGMLDTSFGVSGVVTAAIPSDDGSTTATIYPIQIQSDGKLLILANYVSSNASWEGNKCLLARFSAEGVADSGFGTNGLSSSFWCSGIESFSVMSNQNALIGGATVGSVSPLTYKFILAKYSSVPALDTSFGANGNGYVSDAVGTSDGGQAVTIQSDDKILIAGETTTNSHRTVRISRYNNNGQLDSSFGTAGHVNINVGSNNHSVGSIVVQSDGKILVGGSYSPSGSSDFLLIRLKADGSLDTP